MCSAEGYFKVNQDLEVQKKKQKKTEESQLWFQSDSIGSYRSVRL